MTPPAHTMRELLTLARQRFGAEAVRYKTRQELLEALGLAPPAAPPTPPASPPAAPLVVRDFFRPPQKR